jgi:hypothetical protein
MILSSPTNAQIHGFQRDSSKSSPSATTTAQVMFESSPFASPNTGFFLIWGLGFLVEFCPPFNFFLFFFSDSHLPFLYLAD